MFRNLIPLGKSVEWVMLKHKGNAVSLKLMSW